MREQMNRRSIDVATLETEWDKYRKEVVDLQHIFSLFRVDFLDKNSFCEFCNHNNLWSELQPYKQIFITGYFSETIRETLQSIIKQWQEKKVRLITPFPKTDNDRKNLDVLKRLAEAGAEIKLNKRLHARFLVASNPQNNDGLLLLGSFDFNKDGLSRERFDAGIRTKHPDLVQSATNLFEQIWNEPESVSIGDYATKRS